MRVLFPIRRRRFTPVRNWVVPIAYTVLALVLGFLIPRVDHHSLGTKLVAVSVISETAILSSMASGMMALTGITFSLVFVMVQFGSSAYSPRLVAMLARSRIIRHSAGIFIGTFLFALIALSSVDRQTNGIVPALTTIVAFCWMLCSILALILLIDRVTSLYISNVLSSIGQQGRQVIGTMYAWQGGNAERPASAPNIPPWQEFPVTQTILYHGGPLSVVAFDLVGLVRLAHHADGIIEMTYAVGDTVVDGAPLANVRGGLHSVKESHIKHAIILRTERTIVQDPKYALRLLADVAIRGLSPAVNDPTTAVMALDQIEDLLRRLGRSDLDVGHETDRQGVLRLVYPTPGWEDFLELALLEIINYGAHSIQVMRRLAALLDDLETMVLPSRQAAVRRFSKRLHLSVEHSFLEPDDRQDAEEMDRQGLGLARQEAHAGNGQPEGDT